MSKTIEPRLLLIETSSGFGEVALAEGERLVGQRRLDENRRNARDLAPSVGALLAEQGWRPRLIHGVIVSRGPGSYTGLRVGVMSAKTFAYATGCVLLGIDTFAAVACQAPSPINAVDVIADAQQDRIYVQSFTRGPDGWQPATELTIRPLADWLAQRRADAWATGPGLRKFDLRIPAELPRVAVELRDPQAGSLLRLGLDRFRMGQRDDVWSLEPLYLRPSSAEEQWKALGR
jgi:tRNA threonylcarbamoyladenosine biosynthesis protein TsaB